MNELHARVLVVEDEADIRRFVRLTIESEGHEVFEADSLKRGLIEAGTRRPDVVVLDLGLPDGDGVTMIQDLRNWSQVPVIVLSARGAESDKIAALDAGADDYLVKPFGSGELTARIRAQLRRHLHKTASGDSDIRFGRIHINLIKRLVFKDGEILHLTPIEYKLLTHLAGQPERVITHQQLLKAVWGPGHGQDMHYVRVHMGNLRKKVEDEPSMPKHLLTEAGVGYRFVR
ncbi:MAG TPA: response regulator [Aquabacterium sp.]|nr:response regulator [Aquabacterium sp.]